MDSRPLLTFPKWSNKLAVGLLLFLATGPVYVGLLLAYGANPTTLNVGYVPCSRSPTATPCTRANCGWIAATAIIRWRNPARPCPHRDLHELPHDHQAKFRQTGPGDREQPERPADSLGQGPRSGRLRLLQPQRPRQRGGGLCRMSRPDRSDGSGRNGQAVEHGCASIATATPDRRSAPRNRVTNMLWTRPPIGPTWAGKAPRRSITSTRQLRDMP